MTRGCIATAGKGRHAEKLRQGVEENCSRWSLAVGKSSQRNSGVLFQKRKEGERERDLPLPLPLSLLPNFNFNLFIDNAGLEALSL